MEVKAAMLTSRYDLWALGDQLGSAEKLEAKLQEVFGRHKLARHDKGETG